MSKLAAFRRGWVSLSQDFREGVVPCQYIDTTRKAIDFAADIFYTMKLAADFSSFIVKTCMKDDKFRYLILILRKLGAA